MEEKTLKQRIAFIQASICAINKQMETLTKESEAILNFIEKYETNTTNTKTIDTTDQALK